MTLNELLPEIKQLPPSDKIKLIRFLAEDLDTDDDIAPLEAHKTYFIATPYEAYGAGKVLMEAMAEQGFDRG